MKIKKIFGQIHLWVGLIVGILFFLISISGAIYTWEPEIRAVLYQQKVEPQPTEFVPISTFKATLEAAFPQGDFRTALYRDQASTAQVLLYGQGTYYHAFLNPYTGALVHLQDMNKGGLSIVLGLHRNLLLGKVGRKIVHWVTFLFLIMTITGLVLWWPVNKAGRKQRLTIKWSAKPRKINYDLHNVLGFYASWIVIFCIITGLFWGFEVVRNTLKNITSEYEIKYDVPESIPRETAPTTDQFVIIDSLASAFHEKYPDKYIRVSNPHQKTEPIRVVVISPKRLNYQTDHYYFDQYSGAPIAGNFEYGLREEASSFHTLHSMVYDIHFGTILGLPGRLLVFFASLIAASLPITGFIIWWGKRNK